MSHGFEGVIFSRPGETGLIPYVGALWAAESDNKLNNVNVWISPSTTSFISVMKIIGYSCIDIMALLVILPQLASAPTPFKNLINLGIKLDEIKTILSLKIIEKMGNIPTLEELYTRTGVVFVGIGFSLVTQEIEYIHRETYPNMSLLDVICISLSTPGIYRPYQIGDNFWIDGSILEPFSPSSIELESGNVLAITTKQNKVTFYNQDPLSQVKDTMKSIFESCRQILPTNNMFIVRINSTSKDSALQLREGWEAFTETFRDEKTSTTDGAELQS
jgi:hypothetical protein